VQKIGGDKGSYWFATPGNYLFTSISKLCVFCWHP